MIQLNEQMIEKLTWKGVLAYVAVSLVGSGVYTTATLTQAVQGRAENIKDGLDELSLIHPGGVAWVKKERRWHIGGAKRPDDHWTVFDDRRDQLLDDIKKYWDHLNPSVPMPFGGADGSAVGIFLKRHRSWGRLDWQRALNFRAHSDINRSEPIYKWISKLEEYAAGPLDRYMKPLRPGGEKFGKSVELEESNRIAREAVSPAPR